MISHSSEEMIASASPGADKEAKQVTKSRKLNGKGFNFFWKRDSLIAKRGENCQQNIDMTEVKSVDSKVKNVMADKRSFNFFKNIKRHMQIRNLTICKFKQKTKEFERSNLEKDTNCDSSVLHSDISVISAEDIAESSNILCEEECSDAITVPSQNECTMRSLNETLNYSDSNETLDADNISDNEIEIDNNIESVPNIVHQSCSTNNEPVEYDTVKHSIKSFEESAEHNELLSNNNKIKSLTEELLKLSHYGWYWGPISGNEADAKLFFEPDGAFLVRDSSDDRYVLTLSFKSSGKLLHARMEHSGGLFSLCNQREAGRFSSVADLIDYSMNFSQRAVICYSRPKYPGYPSFPVRLTKPVSRFTQVRSLQYLCRFVIRQYTRLDNIHKLPLPKTIKDYIEEAHY